MMLCARPVQYCGIIELDFASGCAADTYPGIELREVLRMTGQDTHIPPTPDPRAEFRRRFSREGQEFPRRIRRCFMTGKQCIFGGRHADAGPAKIQVQIERENTPFPIFVVMPFRPNLDTFYEWSLKRYLKDGFGISEPEKFIRRADEFRDIGYVMCEKICRRIQEAELVVVDLSTDNPNVMYEMGLAIGLHKPLLPICNQANNQRITSAFREAVGLKTEDILTYPSVGYLDPEANRPDRVATRVALAPRRATMQIRPLVVADRQPAGGAPPAQDLCSDPEDIQVDFREALRAAVGVAVVETGESLSDKSADLQEAWQILRDGEKIDELATLTKDDDVELVDKEGKPAAFRDVAEKVNSAFTCMVDLAGENPHSYFWLGYCHARGINAIPIYRNAEHTLTADPEPGAAVPPMNTNDGALKQHIIAFDIRALWYIHFKSQETRELADRIRASLEELIAKDIPPQQRNVFWERLTRHPMVHIYTGAVHHERLQREVVGDWDQRTVSELVRYLSSAEEAVVPELERPIYSPGTIKEKLKGRWTDPDSLDEYVALVEQELRDKNCLIVASADVNPLTEIVLAQAYELCPRMFSDPRLKALPAADQQRVIVALKGWRGDEIEKSPVAGETTEEEGRPIQTFFSRSGKTEGIKKSNRGFLVDGRIVERSYMSQDEVEKDEFQLLSHFVVMKNPFSRFNQDTLIVLLNGVSGPGTFALAEVLTGGRNTEKAVMSEKLLAEINRIWVDAEAEARRTDRLCGVEGIIEVTIQPRKQPTDGSSEDYQAEETGSDSGGIGRRQSVDEKFFDKREVVEWRLLPAEGDDRLVSGNPRAFYFSAHPEPEAEGQSAVPVRDG